MSNNNDSTPILSPQGGKGRERHPSAHQYINYAHWHDRVRVPPPTEKSLTVPIVMVEGKDGDRLAQSWRAEVLYRCLFGSLACPITIREPYPVNVALVDVLLKPAKRVRTALGSSGAADNGVVVD
ncbi:hypothetical protein ZHAS_00003189 [Anopheles sinensis]|uniref:Uncharacterized protein n=1 Tax=Anopheles sinensis TaxID=74873 RepID=A0A084VDT5_ANOSI|nr:hypothetical protein ZHAS_00003189 [Anopheles sinensis]